MRQVMRFLRTTTISMLVCVSPGLAQVEVIHEVKHDVSPPLTSIPVSSLIAAEAQRMPREIPLLRLPYTSRVSGAVDEVLQRSPGPLISVNSGVNEDGVGQGFSGPQGTFTETVSPSDSNGAAGQGQYVQWVNTSFAVFDKATGSVLYGPVPGNTLWQGFGGQCETTNDGDIIAEYDKRAQRWVMSQLSVSGGAGKYYQCIAVSATPDATGSYYRYAYSMPNFNDYPKLSVWPDAYYASFNMFTSETGTFVGARACAFNRSSMLVGATAAAQCFQLGSTYISLLPSDLDGFNPPPQGSPSYYLSLGTNSSSLNLWKFHIDFANPSNSTFTGPTAIAVAAFSVACAGGTCVPQPSTTELLDSLGDRLMYRLAYRNYGSHESLVANHAVSSGSSVGVRWYEIRSPGTTPSVYQQGTYAPDATYRWMGSIAMDSVGDAAVGYSAASTSVYPSVRYTGRLLSDALGTLESENSIIGGSGSQTTTNRWGDYTAMSIDPIDDCTFWYTDEYLKASGSKWSTRIASFKFPTCTTVNPTVTPAVTLMLE